MTTIDTSRVRGIVTGPGVATGRANPPTARRLLRLVLALSGLLLVLFGATACGGVEQHGTSAADAGTAGAATELSLEALQACREVFARVDAPGDQIVVVWDTTASVADMPFPSALAADLKAASLDDGTLSVIAVDGEGVAPRILAKDVALSTTGERDRPSVAKLAEVMPSCVQAVYLEGLVPTAPGTDLHRAMTIAAEIAEPGATVWTVSDMLPTIGQLALTEDVLAGPPAQAATTAAADAPVDLHGDVWRISGLANAASPLLGANREWVRDFTQGLCGGWNATGCKDIALDPVDPVRTATGLPEDPIPPFPAVTVATTPNSCSFTLPDELIFAGGSARLRDDVDQLLAQPLALLRASEQVTLLIVGHTASSGAYTAAQLLALADARGHAVRDRIVGAGIDDARVTTRGVGDSEPLAEDIDPATGLQIPEIAAAERRVELIVEGAPCSP